MTDKRKYTLRTVEERYTAVMNQINKLEAGHSKKYDKIGRLRNKAQHLLNKLDAVKPQDRTLAQTPQQENPQPN